MSTLELKGVDGGSPLGFLAAIGALRVTSLMDQAARMGWRTTDGAPHPYLETDVGPAAFGEAVCAEARRVAAVVTSFGDIIKTPAELYRNAALASLPDCALPGAPSDADYFSAFACDAIIEKDGMVRPTLLSFSNGGGMQFLLKDFRTLTQLCQPGKVVANILENKCLLDACTNMNWDPSALRSYALRWNDPNSDDKQTDVPLNIMAFLGLAAFPSMPSRRNLATTGFGESRDSWSWPIWQSALSYTVVRAMLTAGPSELSGVCFKLASSRFSENKRLYFKPSVPVT